MIKTEQLYYLTQIEKYGSINKAAESLYMTGSAISVAIRSLEKECGFGILERTYRGVTFTEKGEQVLRYAKQILNIHDEILRMADQPKQQEHYRLLVDCKTLRLVSKKLLSPRMRLLEVFDIWETENSVREQYHDVLNDRSLLFTIVSDPLYQRLQEDESINVYTLYSSLNYPISCKNTKYIPSERNYITKEEYDKLPKILTQDADIDLVDNVVLRTDNPETYFEAILNDLGVASIPRFAPDIYTRNLREIKMYEPIDENKSHMIIVTNKGMDITLANRVIKLIKGTG